MLEIPAYLSSFRGKQLLSLISVAVDFEQIFACCSLWLCCCTIILCKVSNRAIFFVISQVFVGYQGIDIEKRESKLLLSHWLLELGVVFSDSYNSRYGS